MTRTTTSSSSSSPPTTTRTTTAGRWKQQTPSPSSSSSSRRRMTPTNMTSSRFFFTKLLLLGVVCTLTFLPLTTEALFKRKRQRGQGFDVQKNVARDKMVEKAKKFAEEQAKKDNEPPRGGNNERPKRNKKKDKKGYIAPPSSDEEDAGAAPLKIKYDREGNPLNVEKKFRRAKRPKLIRGGRLGLPGRRKKKLGLSAVLFPGAAPEEFTPGEEIPMWADTVTSRKTALPFGYYDLPSCPGPTVARASRLRKNLGAKLQGHDLQASPYEIYTKMDLGCTVVCEATLNGPKLLWLKRLVERQYRVHMTLDSLPVIMKSTDEPDYVLRGYPLGFKAPPEFTGSKVVEYFLYNHVRFVVRYRENADDFDGVRIVGFEAHPVSITHEVSEDDDGVYSTCMGDDTPEVENNLETLLNMKPEPDSENKNKKKVKDELLDVVYSYEVKWIPTTLEWSDRWDIYMGKTVGDDFHFFSLVNSLMVLFFLTGTVAIIVLRNVRKDLSAYNQVAVDAATSGLTDEADESGWKLLHGDIFRPPRVYPSLLCAAVGTGAQIGCAVVFSLLLSVLGFLTPMKKGQMLTTIIVLFVLCGSIAGYISSRLFKFFDAPNTSWKRNMIITAMAFPGIMVSMFLFLDLFLSFAGAATAVSLWTIISVFLLWVGVSTPLVFVGSYLGFRRERIVVNTKTNQIARVIPPNTKWFVNVPYSIVLGGMIPFGSVCVELYFIMSAMWLNQLYYVMGFLLAVIAVLAISCAEMSIVMCYIQLCGEDHMWWWRAFLNSAGAGIWLGLYALWFLSTNLKLVGFLPTMVYVTYMTMMSMAFGLFCGCVGFLASFWFTRKIYGALKVD